MGNRVILPSYEKATGVVSGNAIDELKNSFRNSGDRLRIKQGRGLCDIIKGLKEQ